MALWARSTKNPDVSTGPLARPFARSLAPLTRSLAPHCSLCSRALLRSLAHSFARGNVNDIMSQKSLVLSHSAMTMEIKVDAKRLGDKIPHMMQKSGDEGWRKVPSFYDPETGVMQFSFSQGTLGIRNKRNLI